MEPSGLDARYVYDGGSSPSECDVAHYPIQSSARWMAKANSSYNASAFVLATAPSREDLVILQIKDQSQRLAVKLKRNQTLHADPELLSDFQ